MIAKWLNLLEGGRLSSGGGTVVLGDATVWNSVADWLALGGISGPLRNGDFAPVIDLNPGSGLARYNGTDWELYQALFATKADLEAFPELVYSGATAIVGTGVETDPIYYSDGTTWFRTPDGVHYIYPNELDWASLPTEDTVLNNDQVGVNDLGTPHSSGTAQRHGGNEWRLIQGRFASVSDAQAFDALYPVETDAIALIKSGGGHDEESVAYSYQSGAWTRFGSLSAGYAWTLSSLDDFSAVGLQDGDFGVYTAPAGGLPVVLRYKAAVTRAAGAGGSTVPAWLPPEVYAGTPTLQAYLVGNEVVSNDVAFNAQGWGVVSRTVGTITSQTTRVRLATTGADANVRIETQPVLTTTSKVYARALTRMQVGSGTGTATAFFAHPGVNNGTTGIIPAYISADASKGTFFWSASGTGSTGFDKASQATVAGLTSDDDMVEVIVNTAGGLRTCELYRNGILVSTTDQVASLVTDRVTYQAGSFNAAFTSLATADISQVQVFTW